MRTSRWMVVGLALSLWLGEGVAQAQPSSGQPGFYDVLTPHGDWVVVAGVGTVWRPYARVVGPDFYPYFSGGHWQYTEYGWAWDSDFAWGWVPFHHGRWLFTEPNGWVWVPDDVWGPAWVDWRIGGGYVGWVPMGPVGVDIVFTGYHPRWSWVHTVSFGHRDFQQDRLSDAPAEQEAFRVTSPVLHRDRRAPRGPDPTLVMAPGFPVPRVTLGTPRRLVHGAVTAERRVALVPAPPASVRLEAQRPFVPAPPRAVQPERSRPRLVPAPPRAAEPERSRPGAVPGPSHPPEPGEHARPLVTPAPRPFAPPPPDAHRGNESAPPQSPVLRQEAPEPGKPGPGPRGPQAQPGQLGPGTPQESPEADAARKKEKPKSGAVAPGPGRGKPRGR